MTATATRDTRFGQGYTLPLDLGMVRGVHRQPRLAGGAIVTENGRLASDNYVPVTSGWAIDGSGNAEFNEVVVRGDIEASSFSTGISGERIEIQSGDLNTIHFFTGDVAETQAGYVAVDSDGNVAALEIGAPVFDGGTNHSGHIKLFSQSEDAARHPEVYLLPHSPGTAGSDYFVVRDCAGTPSALGIDGVTQGSVRISATGSGSDVSINANDDIILDPGDAVVVQGNFQVSGSSSFASVSASSYGSMSGSSLNVGSGSITGGAITGASLSLGSGNITAGSAVLSGTLDVDSNIDSGNGGVSADLDMQVRGHGLGYIVTSPDGTLTRRIAINNSGVLTVLAP